MKIEKIYIAVELEVQTIELPKDAVILRIMALSHEVSPAVDVYLLTHPTALYYTTAIENKEERLLKHTLLSYRTNVPLSDEYASDKYEIKYLDSVLNKEIVYHLGIAMPVELDINSEIDREL